MAELKRNDAHRLRGRSSATFVRSATGAGIGAVIGAFLIPRFGAAIGGALGGAIGGYWGHRSDSKAGQ